MGRSIQPIVQPRNLSVDQKRQLGLCFRCGEKYGQGHQCKKLLLAMEGQEDGKEQEAGIETNDEILEGNEGGKISMHALQGQAADRVIKVKGLVRKRSIVVLIDSGNTHSFLDKTTAHSLQCNLQETPLLSMLIANGTKMVSQLKCREFKWLMSGCKFSADLRILKLGGCHVVLGVRLDEGRQSFGV